MKIIKSILISLLFVLLSVFILSPIEGFAKNASLPKAGLTPESPFYFFDKFGEALREFFTFNPEGKARLQITFAAERVAEIKIILETKGVEAKGLGIAQSRLQTHLANAAAIVTEQKSEGKNVSTLAKELDDELETPKSSLADSFKAEKRALETKEDEFKAKLKAAHRAGDIEKEEALAQELGKVKAQKELLKLKKEDIEDALEAEEKKLEEEMEAKEEVIDELGEAREKEKELREEQEEKEREAKEEEEESRKEGAKKEAERLEKEHEKIGDEDRKVGKKRPTTLRADQFSALEKELFGAKASGAFLMPAHYERIEKDLTTLESKGYPANEIERLRGLAMKLAPHLQDQKKTQEPAIISSPPASPTAQQDGSATPTSISLLESQPVLKNLGVNFEPWDKNTNRAGAFIFLSAENKVFLEYGVEVASSEGGTKILPTFEYRTASDAEVFAAMDGVVTNVTYQERNQDYAIHIQPELNSQWILEHDHIRDVKVSKGDTVKAGDILGKVGGSGGELGRTEIMLWSSSATRPTTYCPFKYFDPQLLSEYRQKVLRHMKDWEEFKGNPNLYSEEKHIFPGCVYETLLD